ncbi:acyltransferase family protein [Bradyrhizobium elkanii]|uniref:acyltransferase family protein n=1 Tax=Bradyrhizobium elkanii TaxID=29448 RepID=UPI0038515CE5
MNKLEAAFRESDSAQPADRQISGRARIPELDGMRGIAVLAVVIAHYFGEVEHGIVAFTFGWPGVTMFFVLSGFLHWLYHPGAQDEPEFLQGFLHEAGAAHPACVFPDDLRNAGFHPSLRPGGMD